MDDEKVDPSKLEHQVEVAERAASVVSDQTTAERLRAFAEQVRQMLQRLLTARRRNRSERARISSGNSRVNPRAGTWSSGLRRSGKCRIRTASRDRAGPAS
jgi:hypothetical protein